MNEYTVEPCDLSKRNIACHFSDQSVVESCALDKENIACHLPDQIVVEPCVLDKENVACHLPVQSVVEPYDLSKENISYHLPDQSVEPYDLSKENIACHLPDPIVIEPCVLGKENIALPDEPVENGNSSHIYEPIAFPPNGRKKNNVSKTNSQIKRRKKRKRLTDQRKKLVTNSQVKKSRGRPRKNAPTKFKTEEPPSIEERPPAPFLRRRTVRRKLNPNNKISYDSAKKLPWTLASLALHMNSNFSALQFCQEKQLLPKSKLCPVCKEEMLYSEKLSSDKGLGYVFRCSRRACQIVRSARSGTWFERSKLPIRKSLLLTYCFATNFPFNLAVHESSFTAGCTSPTTVSDWYSYCREVCVDAMTRQMAEKIGGESCIVEMDEAKVGERQYGQKVFDGQWVLGLYCRLTNKASLICLPNNRHDASTLVPVIEEHVHPGSTIVVECWDPEDMLGLGYNHLVNNCQMKFISPCNGLKTTGIDKIWRHLKCSFPQADNYKKAYQLNEYLCEFLWRRWVDTTMFDPFEAFLHDAASLYILPKEEIN